MIIFSLKFLLFGIGEYFCFCVICSGVVSSNLVVPKRMITTYVFAILLFYLWNRQKLFCSSSAGFLELVLLVFLNLNIGDIHIGDYINCSFDFYCRFLLILASQIEHSLEYVLLIEFYFLHLVFRHVCKVNNKADHICGVALEIVVIILTDGVVPPLRIRAWSVQEFIRVKWIGEDVIIVDWTQTILAVISLSNN